MNHNYIRLTSSNGRSVTALRGEGSPRVTGGVGGWEEVERPSRASLVQWNGVGAYQMEMPMLFDGGPDRSSVDDDCNVLLHMGRPLAAGVAPPSITVDGAVPIRGLRWVIPTDGLDWADDAVWHANGYRLRQAVTVTLMQLVQEDMITELPAAEQIRRENAAVASANGLGGIARVYVVKAGDTLPKVAASVYGDYKRWRDIADANGLRDPNGLTVGEDLRIP